MSVSLMQNARAPWIAFEERSVEDRDATIKEGGIRFKSECWVIVRQIGAKDSVEKPAEEWLETKEREAQAGRYPTDWAIAHRKKYEAWMEGREAPPDGTPLKEWAGISRAMAENCHQIGIFTVEDLAAANEDTIKKLGMGGRKFKDSAKAWLDSRLTHGNAEELAALRATVASLEERNKQLEERLAAVETKKGPGRPRKVADG